MNFFTTLLVLALLATQVSSADGKSVTFYTDGAVIELEGSTIKGVLEVPLPAAMIDGSLRIKPGNGTSITRVDIQPARAGAGKTEKELDSLQEQRDRLGDRLQALATREEIFTSAAKSQSGKAPRKTKSNPDPMQAIRQGTEFAIAQLEAVYTSRRRTEQEIRRIDSRISALKNSGAASRTARIYLSTVRGRATVRYALAGQGWVPRFDIRLDGSDLARVQLSGRFSGAFAGYLLHASPAQLAESDSAHVFPVQDTASAGLASYRLPVSDVRFGSGPSGSFSCLLRNTEKIHLPGGDASLYQNGEYIGTFRFEGISSGRTRRISTGI